MPGEVSTIVLKPGRERSVCAGHPWIFSGAIQRAHSEGRGEVCRVLDARGKFIALAYYNSPNSLAARVLSFDDIPTVEAVRRNVRSAVALRRRLVLDQNTDSCRLINGEGDLLPGLVVDLYSGHAIVQSGSCGIDRLLNSVLDELRENLQLESVYEKSTMPCRAEEKLSPVEAQHFGVTPDEIRICENGIKYLINPKSSQKTGFFLDQREMRALVRRLAAGRSVLNCFAFSGGFSLSAMAGGAEHVDSVDVSTDALELLVRNAEINGLASPSGRVYGEDVFEFLRKAERQWDLIVLDPPAFAKRKEHVKRAASGYGEINRLAAKLLAPGGLLITCSCSHHIDPGLFRKIVARAVSEAGRSSRIIQQHRTAFDHPVLTAHPEGDYLKSLALVVD